jgi:Na+/melibiose symporter-like transporter
MLTYYATFAEIVADREDVVLISNVKSVCDVVYFILGYALIPVFIGTGFNIRTVALLFLPLSLTMLIPIFMLKENEGDEQKEVKKEKRVTLIESISFSFKSREFIIWLFVIAVMNFGLQLFLSGINEYFSTTGLNMSFVMASCFAPVPFTMLIYNKIVKTRGLGIAYRYILIMFSVGMALMYFCPKVPKSIMLPYAIGCGAIGSFSIGAFFSVSYTVPSHIAAMRSGENNSASSMFFAIQGLFEGVSAGLASGVALVFLKENGYIPYMTLIVAFFCMAAFAMSFMLPRSITRIGLHGDAKK